MFLFFFSVALAILANVFYHICQKLISPGVNPLASLVITYLTALVCSLIILPFASKQSLLDSFKGLNWASFALGVCIIGLELGFLLAYRAGWKISLAASFTNTMVMIILLPIGLLLFRDKVSAVNLLGVGLSILGLLLIVHK
jgi:drug/metabolite transporter (DMT)-like permease